MAQTKGFVPTCVPQGLSRCLRITEAARPTCSGRDSPSAALLLKVTHKGRGRRLKGTGNVHP